MTKNPNQDHNTNPTSSPENIHLRILAEERPELPRDRKFTLYLDSLKTSKFKNYNPKFMGLIFSHREILHKMEHPDATITSPQPLPYLIGGDLSTFLFGYREWTPSLQLKSEDILPLIFTDEFFSLMRRFMRYKADKSFSRKEAKEVKHELAKIAPKWKAQLQSSSISTKFETMLEILSQKHPKFLKDIVVANHAKMHKNMRDFCRNNFVNLFSQNVMRKVRFKKDCSNCWKVIEELVKNVTRRPVFPVDIRLVRPMNHLYPVFVSSLDQVMATSGLRLSKALESLKSQFLGSDLLRNYFMDMAHSRIMEDIIPKIKDFGQDYLKAFMRLVNESTPALKKTPNLTILRAFLYFSKQADHRLHFNYQNIYDAVFPHRDMYTQAVIFSPEGNRAIGFNAEFGSRQERRERDVENVKLAQIEDQVQKSGRVVRSVGSPAVNKKTVSYF